MSTAERPVIKVCATSPRVELLAQVRLMSSFEDLDPYLQANGVVPTAQEMVAVVDDYLVAPDIDTSDVLEFPSAIILDLFRHITPDPPTGPHPNALTLPDPQEDR